MNCNLVWVSDLFESAPRMTGLTSRGFSTLLARCLRTAKTSLDGGRLLLVLFWFNRASSSASRAFSWAFSVCRVVIVCC